MITRVQLTTLDALKHLRHHVMMLALDKFGPNLMHEGEEMLTRLLRIGCADAQEEIQMPGDLSALLGRETLIVEELRVILEPAAFAGSDTAHGVIISECFVRDSG